MKPNFEIKAKFMLNSRGEVWTQSHSIYGQKTDEQLRYGIPPEATHLIGNSSYRFWVNYEDKGSSEKEVYSAYCLAIGEKL